MRTSNRLLAGVSSVAGWGRGEADRASRDDANMRLLLAFTLSKTSNCIDVGSNEGSLLEEMIRFAPDGHHIAYEPLPTFHDRLAQTFPSVDVRQVALSNVNGTSQFQFVTNLPGYSGLRQRTYPRHADIQTIDVSTETLDGHLPPGYVLDLIKIDVEGAEALVIEGALVTLKRDKPIVVFEFGRGAAEFYENSPQKMHRLLCDEVGLRIFDLDGKGPYDLGEFERTFERGDRWNFFARR